MQENSANKYASIIGTPEHEKIKKQKQVNSANKYANMRVLLGHPNMKK